MSTRMPSNPGTAIACDAVSGRSTRFLKSVNAVRKLFVSFDVSTVSRPTTT